MNSTELISFQKKFQFTEHSGSVYALHEGVNQGEFLSSGGDGIIAEWKNFTTQKPLAIADASETVYSLSTQRLKSKIFAGTISGHLVLTDLIEKKARKIKLHEQGIFSLACSEKHNALFSGSGNGEVSVIDADTFSIIQKIKLSDGKIRSIVANDDESLLSVSCGDGLIHLFEADGLKKIFSIKAHQQGANCSAFLNSGTIISGGRDAMLCIHDITTQTTLEKIPAHNFAIYKIAINENGNFLATASRDKTVKIWNANDLEFIQRLDKEKNDGHINSVNNCIWLNADTLVSCSDDRSVIVWEKS